jgi:hypothetical protein
MIGAEIVDTGIRTGSVSLRPNTTKPCGGSTGRSLKLEQKPTESPRATPTDITNRWQRLTGNTTTNGIRLSVTLLKTIESSPRDTEPGNSLSRLFF